jgi:hypothetical protein
VFKVSRSATGCSPTEGTFRFPHARSFLPHVSISIFPLFVQYHPKWRSFPSTIFKQPKMSLERRTDTIYHSALQRWQDAVSPFSSLRKASRSSLNLRPRKLVQRSSLQSEKSKAALVDWIHEARAAYEVFFLWSKRHAFFWQRGLWLRSVVSGLCSWLCRSAVDAERVSSTLSTGARAQSALLKAEEVAAFATWLNS